MITKRKLQIYAKYDGDIDGWVRMAKGDEIREIGDEDWHEIRALTQRIALVKNGKASAGFESETRKLAADAVDESETFDTLWRLA